MMVSGCITKNGLSKSKVDPCGVCSLRVKANSLLCDKWIHAICAGVKMVTPKFSGNFACKDMKGILEKQLSRKILFK